ncbi:lysophospholipid acyltransferase family protein [Geobacter pelophilus]|uniref:Lysophospholipid acyltransferase family protein n=1 Tax=Geoanaerobacter pelophilus TaxID=60036 RepID=A0AAW4L3M3_9BACT|nr:lysophospholipid acyltransferase family protein [Geoanaerobacter pelophilus]MBT0665553.1 lysophospholipid acyltransferase family protein [Geoanaerobacter pelophilus]
MKELRRNILNRLSPQIAWLIYILLCFFRLTMRIRVVGLEIMKEFVKSGEGFIGIFWHGRLLMIPFVYPGKRMNVLIGTHRDGQLIADVMKCFGFGLVRGSSSKGGAAALREMKKLLAEGDDIAITPDGPRGPAEVAKIGVAQSARVSGRPVVPVAFSSSHSWRGTSWDKMLIPKPFSKGVFVIGAPLRYCEGEDLEVFRLRIETALKETTAQADCFFTETQQ